MKGTLADEAVVFRVLDCRRGPEWIRKRLATERYRRIHWTRDCGSVSHDKARAVSR